MNVFIIYFRELLDHSRLHGEDLANVHQNNTESESYSVNSARKQLHQNLDNGIYINF